jgi:TatD DNase family protein
LFASFLTVVSLVVRIVTEINFSRRNLYFEMNSTFVLKLSRTSPSRFQACSPIRTSKMMLEPKSTNPFSCSFSSAVPPPISPIFPQDRKESNEPFIDPHIHIDQVMQKLGLQKWEQVKAKFPKSFEGCITVACSKNHFNAAKKLLDEKDIYGVFGIHPHNSEEWSAQVEQQLLEFMKHPKVLAWGEIGLDNFMNFISFDLQKKTFARQLELALSLNKRLVIHSRETEDETFQIMKSHIKNKEYPIHLHSYVAGPKFIEKLLGEWKNLYIGFTGMVTFHDCKLIRDVAAIVPLNRIILESDGPHMAPVPMRGQVSHSGMIGLIASKVAAVKKITEDDLLKQVRKNVKEFYGI